MNILKKILCDKLMEANIEGIVRNKLRIKDPYRISKLI
jgi:hypothetical protein